MTSKIEVDDIMVGAEAARTPDSASPDVADPLRSMRLVKWLTRLFVYPGVTALIPLDHFLTGLTWEQAISVHLGGFVIATIAIEIAFGQVFKLRKQAAYPNVLIMELGEAQTVDAAVRLALPVLHRLLGVRASFIALAGDEAEHCLASAYGMSQADAQRYLRAGASSIREATHAQQPVLWEPDGAKSGEVRLNGDERLFLIPVVALQQPIGVLAVVGRKGNRDLKDGQLMRNIGSVLGLSLENLRQEEALRESESRFRTLVESGFEGIAISEDGKILEANESFARMFGYESAEVIGLSPLEVATPESAELVMKNIQSGYEKPYEVTGVKKDGTTFDIELIGKGCLYKGRNARITAFRDVTERKQAAKALRESETKFRTLAETSAAAIFIDQGSRFMYVNSALEVITGYSREELLAMELLDLIHPDFRELVKEQGEARVRGEQTAPHYEIKILTKSGEERWVDVTAGVIEFEGKPSVLGTAFDVTERKRAEEALRESETKFRTLAETSAAATFIFQGTRLRYVNSATEALTGYDREELLTMNRWDVMHPDFQELVKQRGLARQLGEPVSRRYEAKLLTKNGEERWADFTLGVIEFEGEPAVLGTAFDVTERKRAEDALRKLSCAVEQSPSLVIIADSNGIIQYVNPKFTEVTGYTAEEAIGKTPRILKSGETPPEEYERLWETITAGGEWRGELHNKKKNGELYWASVTIVPVKDAEGTITHLLGVQEDITDRKRAEEALQESEEKYRDLVENMSEVLYALDKDGRITYVSPVVEQLGGYTPSELIGRSFTEFIHPDDLASLVESFQKTVAGNLEPSEFRIFTKSGEIRWVRTSSRPVFEGDRVVGLRAVMMDITERKQAEETIKHLAYHDALTNLANRTMFEDRLAVTLAQARRKRRMAAVMFLDLDQFKVVNDTVGHALGDRLLQDVAERLTGLVRDGDTVARVGGDEFTLLLHEVERVEEVAEVAERVLDALRQPWVLNGHEFRITTSIGIAMFPSDGEDADSLLRNADTAMYRAKDQGRDNYKLYTPSMNTRIAERLALENSLRHGLERGEFLVHYQPQVEITTGKIVGMEALVRWQHPERGLVFPAEFIPVAEETGLIVPLGEWVLRTACAQNKAWQAAGFPPMRMAVNLSARQFQQRDLIEVVDEVLKETGLEARWLQLEITEGVAMQDVESNIAVLRELRQMGVQIAIDDFGTGHSSLSYLSRLPIDVVKIDQSFVQNLTTNPNEAAIARSIIVMAHNLKLKVIAEGVETEEQLAFLKKRRCDEMQGYLFSKPAPAEAFEEMLKQNARTPRTRRPVEASR